LVSFSTIGGQDVQSGVLYTSDNGSAGAPLEITGSLGAPLNTTTANGASAEQVQVSLDGGATWQAASVDASGTNWSYTAESTVNDGNYTFMARIVDLAGNVSSNNDVATQQVGVQTSTAETASIGSISPDTEVSGGSYGSLSDFITSTTLNSGDGSLTISGTTNASAGQTVQVSFDGGHTWGDATVSGTEWSYTAIPGQAGFNGEGTYTAADVLVQVVNQAGVAGTQSDALQPITVDNTAPSELVSFTNIGVPTGAQLSVGSTEIQTTATSGITLYGTLSEALPSTTANGVSAEQLQISVDGGAWQAVTNFDSTDTQWSYAIPGSLAMGDNSVQMRVVDEAGNIDPNITGAISITVVQPSTPSPSGSPAPE
jgi:hypothetical protein